MKSKKRKPLELLTLERLQKEFVSIIKYKWAKSFSSSVLRKGLSKDYNGLRHDKRWQKVVTNAKCCLLEQAETGW